MVKNTTVRANSGSLFLILSILLVTSGFSAFSQVGGGGTYQFLNLTNSARIAAMGGTMLAIKDNDVNLTLANPSLISKGMDKNLALSFVDYYSDVNYGFAMFSSTLPSLGSYVTSLQYINYGKFTKTDETGLVTGDFTASEYSFNLGWGRQLDSNFSIGANLRTIYSSLYDDISYGVGVDVAASYYNPRRDLTISVVARNAGRQIKTYKSGIVEPFPFQMSLGLSKKLKHLPFRYSIVYNRLDQYDLSFKDPATVTVDPLTNLPIKKDKVGDFFDNLGRHFIIGGEFMPSPNLSLRVGYNYEKRKELGVDTKMSTVGFSWGFGIRIKKFQFNYSRSTFHLAGSPNYITMTVNLADFLL
ncbi:MAG: type IX secretion system protein PorQ [Bacteroidetes bacterium]|nr:type IX secretion system protein PorQ [Bacteroidota bacterium]